MTLRIGHRGAAGTHPENTLASFRRAVEAGMDGIELDVHRTRDGHLVVIHDPTLDRTTDGTGYVRDLTLDQVRQADAGKWKGDRFAGERVPTLQELFRALPSSLRFFVELKAGSIHYPGIEEDLVRLIRAEGMEGRTEVSSFDHQALLRISRLAPDLELGMLFADNPVNPVRMAQECGARALHPFWQWVTPEMVRSARSAGLRVAVWTVNDPAYISLLRDQLRVDGIMSDFPERLV